MTRSTDQNLLVLTIYIIGVSYVFNLMRASIDDRIKYEFKKSDVDDQLKAQELDEKISISFKLNSSYPLEEKKEDPKDQPLKELSMSIENKSDNIAIYVDWDNSSLIIENSKQSYRVIRRSPDLIRDLGVPQSPSLIVPKKTLSQTLSGENLYERDQGTGTYTAKKPIVDISELKKNKSQAKLYNDFINGREELKFSLQLVLRLSEVRAGLAPGVNVPPISIINCPFTIRKLPWTYALPWNKKK
ncbi:hypothetical protein [Anabaena subtropica]|uniref:Uncharacterized protein n=1 Tax=Anabaena subtropica FACHB-260 TaxID=2692884 RepID=A0ABR8CUL9_9NOST|nr:hypothetical protein [Anabaena subtropica]MBD2346669.1 hypothetical protein [Anabaena subtropica FACHB-260]